MARLATLNVSAYTLGGTDFLGDLISADFNLDIALASCKGITSRHNKNVETKRTLTFSAEHKRRVAAADCETMLTLSTLTFNCGSVKANVKSGSFKYSNKTARADAGGDQLAQVVLTGTDTEGSLELYVNVGDASTLLGATALGGSITTSITITDGVGTVTQAIKLKNVKKHWEQEGVVMITAGFQGNGTPSSAGGGMFATGLTGTGTVVYVVNDLENLTGNAVILSGEIKFQTEGVTTESYSFHCNTVAAS
jgi:hypothetical protein